MIARKFALEVQPRIPRNLRLLEELANNLLYSWDRQVRTMFYRLDGNLWELCGHNPKVFLRRISQERLEQAARDPVFLQDYKKIASFYHSYMQSQISTHCSPFMDCRKDLISYSCAEFGLHESFPIYSGGLGILAGDYCKGMSDLNVPFVAVGLLYRQGYFQQQIDGHGNQVANYIPSSFEDLPVSPAVDEQGQPLEVSITVCKRKIRLKIWIATVGHIKLILLDSDIAGNNQKDRSITYQLYGGNAVNRLLQEMVLGIGGVRAQRALGLQPTVWHINEGHSAFQVVERCREFVTEHDLDFRSALEAASANTVFTTHTPVAAGHDIFDTALIEQHFSEYVAELGISMEEFFELGRSPHRKDGFNMTALALRCSRTHNGVSRIHSTVTSEIEGYIWPQIPAEDNPIECVTNAIHVPTFLASEWANMFNDYFGGGWHQELLSDKFWDFVDDIPDYSFWSRRQILKANMLEFVFKLVDRQHRRNGYSESQINRLTRFLKPQKTDILIIGFARRFATYKRATLIFSDEERLARLMSDPEHPVMILFSGKAHPNDEPGQELIKQVYEMSLKPAFEGKVIFVENYDIGIARKLVSGVDVWLNNPEYPLEASGTSGQKAGINGVLNLSVLDGWWAEGYNGNNGWAITPHGANFTPEFRDREEARELMDVLEQNVMPLYFNRDSRGIPTGWVEKSKASMRSLMPLYNVQRMVMDYLRDCYSPAIKQGAKMLANGFSAAKELAAWKAKTRTNWKGVSISLVSKPADSIRKDDNLSLEVAVNLNGLTADDIVVECLFEAREDEVLVFQATQVMAFRELLADGSSLFSLSYAPSRCGLQSYTIRCYPFHENLSHRFELGGMIWVE